jgi:hypothetical protein
MDNITFTEKIKDLIRIKNPPATWHDCNPKIALIHQARKCEDCDRTVMGRSVTIYIKRWSKDPEWTKSCNICKEKITLTNFGKKKSLQAPNVPVK